MSALTPEKLAELRWLLERATPGPWHAWDRGIGYEVHTEVEHNPIHCVSLNSEFRETFRGTDARLIAAAVNALPALLGAAAERDALADRLDIAEAGLDRVAVAMGCGDEVDGRGVLAVAEARMADVRALHFGEYVEDEDRSRCFECGDEWPCPTIRALGGAES